MFYTFSQMNSGGSFIGDYRYIIIEADSADEANQIAEDHGVYFDGCYYGIDCRCCGDRWHRCWEYDGTENPEIYGIDPKIAICYDEQPAAFKIVRNK